jgi:glycosyltransferase involved in cell wall biosynthesis
MSDQPLVSIIIPTYNRAHLIGETLDSVVAQTYKNWECIIVDDGSSDNTDQVVGKYVEKDTRFRYYHRPKERKKGGNICRNIGIDKAQGDFISFLDSDDFIVDFALKDKIKFFDNNFHVILSRHTRSKAALKKTSEIVNTVYNDRYDERFLVELPATLMGDALISKAYLGSYRFDEDLLRGQDHIFYAELFRKKGNFIKIDGIHYLYNITPDSITARAGSGQKKYFSVQIEIAERMMKEYQHNPEIVKAYKRKSRMMYKSLIKKHKFDRIIENYNHFRKAYNLNFIEFTFWVLINILTNNGFDKMKNKIV